MINRFNDINAEDFKNEENEIKSITLEEYNKKILVYIESIKSNGIEMYNKEINFDDDLWDFNSHIIDANALLKFEDMDNEFKILVKLYLIDRYKFNKLVFITLKWECLKIKRIISLFNEANVIHPLQINYYSIEKIVSENIESKFLKRNINVIKRLIFLMNDIGIFNSYIGKVRNYFNNLKIKKIPSKHFENIDSGIFNRIISCAILELGNENLNNIEKEEAAITLLITQTGLRCNDIRKLEFNRLEKSTIKSEKKIIYYLRYLVSKKGKKHDEVTNPNNYEITFMTDYAVIAYKELCRIFEYKKNNTKYIFLNEKGKLANHQVIFNKTCRFLARNAQEIKLVNIDNNNGFHNKLVSEIMAKKSITIKRIYLEDFCESDIISFPTIHQYRTTVATLLYKQGKELSWIKKHMRHMYFETTCAYIKNINREENENKAIKRLFDELKNTNTEIIGVDSDNLNKKIINFIKNEEARVGKNLDDIIRSFDEMVPIRKKKMGYCIKSFYGRKCELNEISDKLSCAFGNCPNNYYVLEDIVNLYEQGKEINRIVQYNQENMFIMQAKKEQKKLNYLINTFLNPAIKKLECSEKYKKELLMKGNSFTNFVSELPNIKNEVEEWKR